MGMSYAEFEALTTYARRLQLRAEKIDAMLRNLAMKGTYCAEVRFREPELEFYPSEYEVKDIAAHYPGWAVTYHNDSVINDKGERVNDSYYKFAKLPAK
jgi:hypothetical protein